MTRAWTSPEPPSFRLCEGAKLKIIYLPGNGVVQVGSDNTLAKCEAITVQMEPGQMAAVPWARARYADGSVSLWNLANVEGVEFLDTLPADPGDEGGDE